MGHITATAQLLNLTLEDLIPAGENYTQYRPDKFPATLFAGESLWYQQKNNLYSFDPKRPFATGQVIAEIAEMRASESLFTKLVYEDRAGALDSSDIKIEDLKIHPPHATFYCSDRFYVVDTDLNKLMHAVNITQQPIAYELFPKSKALVYTDGNNLYYKEVSKSEVAVTQEASSTIHNGSIVYRNEFGIEKGFLISPNEKFIAYYRMDDSEIEDYPLLHLNGQNTKVELIRYPKAGGANQTVKIAIYDIEAKNFTFLQTGQPEERYLTLPTFSLDSKFIWLTEINRAQNEYSLRLYSVQTGAWVRTLFTERDLCYVNPEAAPLSVPTAPGRIIIQSQRSGYNHLYLYNLREKEPMALTSGSWNVLQVLGFRKQNTELVYISNEDNPLYRRLYAVDLRSGKRRCLTPEPGVHKASLSASGNLLLDSYSQPQTPSVVQVVDLVSAKRKELFRADDPYAFMAIPSVHIGQIKAADHTTDLYYRMVKPADFDSTKQYPVIIYCYGGPTLSLINESWMYDVRGWDLYMAQRGYIVFTLDGRGSAHRSKAFEQATWQQLGRIEAEDQMAGVAYLSSLAYVDRERIGVHGWSFGGFLTTYLTLHYPTTFKVAVAGAPVLDWRWYEVMYGERYMGTPTTNPSGYDQADLVSKAGNLKGRLLLIYGDQDPVVIPQHTMAFIESSIHKRTYPDLFIYPGHRHNIKGRDRVHLYEKISRYFDDYLLR